MKLLKIFSILIAALVSIATLTTLWTHNGNKTTPVPGLSTPTPGLAYTSTPTETFSNTSTYNPGPTSNYTLTSTYTPASNPTPTSNYTLTSTCTPTSNLTSTSTANLTSNPTPTSDLPSLIVMLEDEKTLSMYSKLPDGKILLTSFSEKDWGTWNINGWYVITDNKIPSNRYYSLANGTSDWEYVFRVSKNPSGKYYFSGGNHENEILNSLKFYDADKETELFLKKEEKHHLSCLKIVEETYLTINNSPSEIYAKVVRSYLFSPSKITLDTTFDFISDIYMGTSYICMLPTNKLYGKHIKFMDSQNVYSTPEFGSTLTTDEFENFIGKEKSMSVKIWGDSNPSYSFLVGIKDEKSVDYFNNDLKVFFWDLNKQGNKLYFSKYSNDNFTLVKKGTRWENSVFWELIVEK